MSASIANGFASADRLGEPWTRPPSSRLLELRQIKLMDR
jgi:hypothetical protein